MLLLEANVEGLIKCRLKKLSLPLLEASLRVKLLQSIFETPFILLPTNIGAIVLLTSNFVY